MTQMATRMSKKYNWFNKQKKTTLQVHHAFSDLSFLVLHDYNVKMPNINFCIYGGQNFISLSELGYGP